MEETAPTRLLKRIRSVNSYPAEGSLAFPPDQEETRLLCDQLRSYLPEFDLSDEEILAIARIFDAWNSKEKSELPPVPTEIFTTLKNKGVIEETTSSDSDLESGGARSVALNQEFLSRLAHPKEAVQPFASLREYYVAWFRYVTRLKEYRSNELHQHPFITDEDHGGKRVGTSTPWPTATEREFQRSFETLLQRSSTDTNRFPIEVLVRSLELDDNERRIVLYLLYSSLFKIEYSAEDLLTLISSDPFEQFRKEGYLSPASKLRFFEVIIVDPPRLPRPLTRASPYLNPRMKTCFLTCEGETAFIPDLLAYTLPYASNKEYLHDWLRYIRGFIHVKELKDAKELFSDGFEFCDDSGEKAQPEEYLPLLNRLKELITTRARISEQPFPLQTLIDKFELSEVERDILLIGLHGYLKSKSYHVSLVKVIMRVNEWEDGARDLFWRKSKLVKNGLIVDPRNNLPPGRVVLTTYAAETLLGKEQIQSGTVTLRALLSTSEILHEITPQQTLDDLVLPASLRETLHSAVARYESGADNLLREWGILSSEGNSSHCSSLTILYSGLTGTGKTYAAGALANALRRPIVTTDISKLLSHWVGKSEQLVVNLFDEYKVLVERLPESPVLLLNECDQFFMRRMVETEQSVDRMYNQMQDIFLERLESFTGVLIATTNLVGSIDEAFSRRFHYKLDFPFPDAQARRVLWERHLKPPIPLDEDVDMAILSEQYRFNGGQISLAVKNAAIQAAIRGDRIYMRDLRNACEEEQKGTFDTKSMKRKPVGFKCL